MNTILNDIKFGLRMICKSPGFSLVVVLVMGIGMGVNTALFNAFDQVALRSLPVPEADRLVAIRHAQHGTDISTNYPIYESYRDHDALFSDLVAFSEETLQWRRDDVIREIPALVVSGNYFSGLRLMPKLGRLFHRKQETEEKAHPVAVISARFWEQHFARDPNIIGQQILVNNQWLTVVGITPSLFTGTVVGWVPDLYIPLGTYGAMRNDRIQRDDWTWLTVLGRLEPEIRHPQALAKINMINDRLEAAGVLNVEKKSPCPPEDTVVCYGKRNMYTVLCYYSSLAPLLFY